MADITADLVKKLRDMTNVSMMECKRALTDANGDMNQATKILRERGIATAAKKSTRTANQGVITSAVTSDGKTVSLVEINCETDFVARNESFQSFSIEIARKACDIDGKLADKVKAVITAKVAEIGENIVLRRNCRLQLTGKGKVEAYIHQGQKIGVIIEVGCEKDETLKNNSFNELVRDIALHIAASAPQYLTAHDVPQSMITSEREIYAKQITNKPPQIIEKIIDGKIKKYFSEVCLVDQPFVKEPKQTITQLLSAKSKEMGDILSIRKFARYQLGEEC